MRSFRFWHSLLMFCFLSALFWSLWAGAQTPAPPASSTGTNSAVQLTFGLDRVGALQTPLLGQAAWKYIAAAIYIVLAIVAAWLVDFIIGVQLKNWAKKTTTQFDDIFISLVHGPIKIITFVGLLYIGLEVFAFQPVVEDLIRKALGIVVAISIIYLATRLVEVLMAAWRERSGEENRLFNQQLFPIIQKTLKIFVLVIGILTTAQMVFHKDISTILASLSVLALAVGLAAQDTIANLFGAVIIFVDRPFKIADRIQLDGVDGVVESIGLRSTRVRNLDGHLITIPNKTMGSATITNITLRPNIKTVMNIGITYDTSVEKIREALKILEQVFRAHPQTGDLQIAFNKFEASALNIQVVHWWSNTDHKAYLAGMQEMNLEIKGRFDAAGISFAFPSQTVYVKQA